METSRPLRNIVIVGAGFSGLTLASLLAEVGNFRITIYDKQIAGGMINSIRINDTLFENAAPSLLNHHEFESFASRQGVKLHPALHSARKRYLFVDKPARWPLGWFATLKFLIKVARFAFLKNKIETLNGLTLEDWSIRNFGTEFTEKVLRTAALGVYAGPISELSAELVAKRFFTEGRPKNRAEIKGSVVPEGGLSNFMVRLKSDLQKKNVEFIPENPGAQHLTELQKSSLIVFATGFTDFSGLVSASPESFLKLDKLSAAEWQDLTSRVKTISLAKAHLLLPDAKHTIDGFGILFHPSAGFQALGVIANSRAFSAYGPTYNESWILKCTDTINATQSVLADRQKLFGESEPTAPPTIKLIKNVYPLYDKNLQKWLAATRLRNGFFATGNYWGALGLTEIFLQNQKLCESILNYEKK